MAIILSSSSAWGEIFGDEVVAAAIIDRLVHDAEILSLKGDSYRLRDKASALHRHATDRGRATPLRRIPHTQMHERVGVTRDREPLHELRQVRVTSGRSHRPRCDRRNAAR
jgi:hypothetical protein